MSDGNLRRVHRRIYRVAITTNGLLSLSGEYVVPLSVRLYLCKVWLTCAQPVNFDSQSKVLQDIKVCQRIKDQCDLQTVSSFV